MIRLQLQRMNHLYNSINKGNIHWDISAYQTYQLHNKIGSDLTYIYYLVNCWCSSVTQVEFMPMDMMCGVPQGSSLFGPQLFILTTSQQVLTTIYMILIVA